MAVPDFAILDGFDHYTTIGDGLTTVTSLIQREWPLSGGTIAGFLGVQLTSALTGTGIAGRFSVNGSAGTSWLYKNFGVNYARSIGTYTWKNTISGGNWTPGIVFTDGTTAQFSIGIINTGAIVAYRGDLNGTAIATSSTVANFNIVNNIAWDITFHNSTGIIKVWLNGTILTELNLTGQDTCATANNYINGCGIGIYHIVSGTKTFDVDHLYCAFYSSSGGSEVPPLDSPLIETQFPTSDTATVQFNVGPTIVGAANVGSASNTNINQGANRIYLVPITPEASGNLNSISILPRTTSASAKLKAVLYTDSSGAPNTLTATGTEVVGITNGSVVILPFSSGQALTAGTQYWLGFITDTAFNFAAVDNTGASSLNKANTYTSGAPSPAGSGYSGTVTPVLWGNMTGATTHFTQVNQREPTLYEYNSETTVNDKDLFNFPALSLTPTNIYCVAVKAACARTDGGARTINLLIKSNATTANGTLGTVTPPLSLGYLTSNFFTDPNTSVTWTSAGLNASTAGYEIAS